MTLTAAIITAAIALLALALLARHIENAPRRDIPSGLAWHAARLYARLVHRLTIKGRHNLDALLNPTDRHATPGPLVVVANHTAGIDPILLQAAIPFFVRFVMARDMRHPLADPFLEFVNVIFVDRTTGDAVGLRDAIAHAKAGGALGLFPEGGIARPPRTLLPFQPGVGLIIRRAHARVLPVIITGTPAHPTAWGSLYTPSRSTIEFMPPIDYTATGLTAAQIASDLHARFRAWTNWPDAPARQAQSATPP